MVFGKKTEHPRHRVHGSTQANPQRGGFGNGVFNQLSESLLKDIHSRRQGTPRSLEATGLHDTGRRVQTLGLDPRPTIEVALQSLGPNRPIRQSMSWQYRDRPTARTAQIAGDPFQLGSLRIGVARVVPMEVDRPRTTARTHRPRSSELIFANLNAAQNPDSSRPIKPHSAGLHDSSSSLNSANGPVSRSHRTSQRYSNQNESERSDLFHGIPLISAGAPQSLSWKQAALLDVASRARH